MDVVLRAQDVRCGYGSVEVVRDISFTVRTGEVLCLLGPNGVGKTTLFKSILGFLPLRGGRVVLAGRDLSTWRRRELARVVAYVPQAHGAPFPFTVGEVVLMGRTPRLGVVSSPGLDDLRVAHETLDSLGIAHLTDRSFTQISGGERQLVLIARALAQQPTLLMMDEPTSNLDLGNQVQVLRQIRAMAAAGLAIVMISHTPDHAFAVAIRGVAPPGPDPAGRPARAGDHGCQPGLRLWRARPDPHRHRPRRHSPQILPPPPVTPVPDMET
jgi:iron complex transport system ATP-binding protein